MSVNTRQSEWTVYCSSKHLCYIKISAVICVPFSLNFSMIKFEYNTYAVWIEKWANTIFALFLVLCFPTPDNLNLFQFPVKVWVIGIQLYWHFHNLTRSDKKLKFPKYYCPEITFLPLTHHLFHYSHDDANCVFSSLKARKAQVSKWFELWGNIWSCSVIIHVRIGPRGTVVTWGDWHFHDLGGSQHKRRVFDNNCSDNPNDDFC